MGGEPIPAGLGSLLPVPCAGVGPLPPAPHPACPAILLTPTLHLAPKSQVPLDEDCLASPGVPCPLALVGGPCWATLGQLPPSNPIQEPVPAGLEMLYIYESIFFPPL